MDAFPLEFLLLCYDGLIRGTTSTAVVSLRLLAYTLGFCGPGALVCAWFGPAAMQSYFVFAGVACLLAFLAVTLSCAALVRRENKND